MQLATRRWRIKNLSSCRGGVTHLQLFSQLATRTITNKMADALSRRHLIKMSSDLPILTKLRCKLQRGCYTQATCLGTLRKVEGRSTFLATHNARIAVAKWGVTRELFLATCNATFVALQVASSTNFYIPLSFLLLIHSSSVHSSNKSITRKQAAALFRREKFILLQVCLTGRQLVFTFLRGKSLELAALVTLLARLPVNYHQLPRTSLAV